MKKFTTTLLGLVVITTVSFFSFSSCSKDDGDDKDKDPCVGVTCNNGGTAKANGSDCNCECVLGYEGSTCDTKTISKFVGNYGGAREECTSAPSFAVSITIAEDSTDATKVKITNLSNAQRVSSAKAAANGNLIIENQPFSNTSTVSGVVKMENGKKVIEYVITVGSATDSCKAFLD